MKFVELQYCFPFSKLSWSCFYNFRK